MDQQVRPTFNPGLYNGSIGDKKGVHASLETKLNRKMIPQVTQKVVFYCSYLLGQTLGASAF